MEKDLACVSKKILNTTAFETSKIILKFPEDNTTTVLDSYGFCESAPLFSDLRELDRKSNSQRQHVTIHKLKFNLNDILMYTDRSITESVTVYADTVYMNETLEITFQLKVRARVVLISHPIMMVLEEEQRYRRDEESF